MDNKNRNADGPPQAMGLPRDVKRMKADTADTVAELRDFIQHLRGKPPQEVLGLVAKSGLVRATTTATIGTVVLLAIFTIGPYVIAKASPKPPPAPEAAAASAEAAEEGQGATATADGAATASPSAAGTQAGAGAAAGPLTPDQGAELLERLGEGDTRESDPSVNPLEDSADDLLDELQ